MALEHRCDYCGATYPVGGEHIHKCTDGGAAMRRAHEMHLPPPAPNSFTVLEDAERTQEIPKQERVQFAEPDPPRIHIPKRNELIARGFVAYLKKCKTTEEAVHVLSDLLDELKGY